MRFLRNRGSSVAFRRRIIAAAISLVTFPGVGHYYLGDVRACIRWLSAFVGAFGALIALATHGPAAFAVTAALGASLHLAAAADLLRARSTRPPPTARSVVVAIAAFALMVGIKSWVRTHLVESLRIPGNSMYPTLSPGDRVLVSKRRKAPAHGDVVAYRAVDGGTYIKRVMATQWEVIEVRGSGVWVNKQNLPQEPNVERCAIDEHCIIMRETQGQRTYPVALSTKESTLNPKPELRVPMGHVFLMGDARRWSLDSRMTGPVSTRDVIGTAAFVWWPLSRFGLRP
jgi:signal peptidase I